MGFVPLSKTGADLLFELISQRYERCSTPITSGLPFEEWTETFDTGRLTGALLDRLPHHVNILEMNGESHRLNLSRARLANPSTQNPNNWPDGQCALERACYLSAAGFLNVTSGPNPARKGYSSHNDFAVATGVPDSRDMCVRGMFHSQAAGI